MLVAGGSVPAYSAAPLVNTGVVNPYVNPFGLSYPGLGIAPPAASVYASRISMVPPTVPSAFNPYTGINPAYNPLVATRLAASNAALAAAENAYNTRLAEHAYVTRLAASNAALASVETVHASRLALIAAAAGHPFSSVPVDGRLYSSAPESVAFGMQTAMAFGQAAPSALVGNDAIMMGADGRLYRSPSQLTGTFNYINPFL